MLKELSRRNKFVYEDPSLARLLSEDIWSTLASVKDVKAWSWISFVYGVKMENTKSSSTRMTANPQRVPKWLVSDLEREVRSGGYRVPAVTQCRGEASRSDTWHLTSSQWRILVDHISRLRSMVRRAKSPENSSARHCCYQGDGVSWRVLESLERIAVTLQCEAGYNPSKILISLKLTAKTSENGWLEDYFSFGKAHFQGLC